MNDAVLINAFLATGYLVFIAVVADRYEREPTGVLLKLFLVSMLATGAFGILKCNVMGLCEDMGSLGLFEDFVIAGLLEELLKFGVLLWFLRRTREVDEPMDGIVYLVIIAMGFAFDENIGYFLYYTEEGRQLMMETGQRGMYDEQLKVIFLVRALPGHLLFNTIGGWVLAVGIQRGNVWRAFLPALVLCVLLHGAWNALAGSLVFVLYALALLVLSIIGVVWASRRSPHRARQNELMGRVRAVEWSDGSLPRKLRSAIRRTNGQRQMEMMRVVELGLTETPRDGEERILGMMAEERSHGNPVVRMAALVGGMLVVFYSAEFVMFVVRVFLAG